MVMMDSVENLKNGHNQVNDEHEADADNISDDDDVGDDHDDEDEDDEDGSSNPHAENESLDEEDINNAIDKGKTSEFNLSR